ncbi:MAG: DNA replication and repair protein RecF [Patescibacteria group bacterium]
MLLQKLSLQNFRSFSSKIFEFNSPITLIVGSNAIGKTSIIEAIALISNGSSFRAGKVEEMIKFDEELGRVKAIISAEDAKDLEILLTRGMVQGRRSQRTLYSVNDLRRRKKDFIGKLLAVSFRPEDMRLVEGSPSRRRQFIDSVLCLVDRDYARSQKVYLEALKKRNKLLWQIREGLMGKQVLSYWNLQLLKHGKVLQKKRRELFRFFNTISFSLHFEIGYKSSLISEKRMQEYEVKELVLGHTLIGPHKDDFIVKLRTPSSKQQDFDIGIYGSRGQQRLAVLWLKICELEFIEDSTNQRPILLLDDILSELDDTSKSYVLKLLDEQQTIITSADKDTKKELSRFKFQIIKL